MKNSLCNIFINEDNKKSCCEGKVKTRKDRESVEKTKCNLAVIGWQQLQRIRQAATSSCNGHTHIQTHTDANADILNTSNTHRLQIHEAACHIKDTCHVPTNQPLFEWQKHQQQRQHQQQQQHHWKHRQRKG